MEVYSRTKLYR